MLGDVEAGLAVGEVERAGALGDRIVAAGLEQPRRPRVIGRRGAGSRIRAVTGPKYAHLPLDLLVSDAGVVGDAAFARDAQLLEDRARVLEGEAVGASERGGEILDDAPVLPGLAGALDCLVDLDDATFDLGDGAFVLFLQAPRQHDVGVLRGVVQEEVDHREELELLERAGDELTVGERHLGVEADREERLDLARVDLSKELVEPEEVVEQAC